MNEEYKEVETLVEWSTVLSMSDEISVVDITDVKLVAFICKEGVEMDRNEDDREGKGW